MIFSGSFSTRALRTTLRYVFLFYPKAHIGSTFGIIIRVRLEREGTYAGFGPCAWFGPYAGFEPYAGFGPYARFGTYAGFEPD